MNPRISTITHRHHLLGDRQAYAKCTRLAAFLCRFGCCLVSHCYARVTGTRWCLNFRCVTIVESLSTVRFARVTECCVAQVVASTYAGNRCLEKKNQTTTLSVAKGYALKWCPQKTGACYLADRTEVTCSYFQESVRWFGWLSLCKFFSFHCSKTTERTFNADIDLTFDLDRPARTSDEALRRLTILGESWICDVLTQQAERQLRHVGCSALSFRDMGVVEGTRDGVPLSACQPGVAMGT